MSVRECVITPEVASEMLDRNTNNRALSGPLVDKMVRAMQSGEWQFNGDTIRVSKSGRLLDGQHRLSAIEKSGIPQRYVVVDGLDDDTFTTIDIGKARTAGDMLSITGNKNCNALAAAARMVLTEIATGKPIHGSTEKSPSHTQIVDFAESDFDIQDAVNYCIADGWVRKYVGPSLAAYCYYRFGKHCEKTRDKFFSELSSGEYSYADSPVRFIRELFIEEKRSPGKPDRTRRVAAIFKAFCCYRDNKPIKILRLEKNPEGWFKL